ncbi:MAG: DUF4230 domain-containing protein [Anaerolineales bacterium]|nr:DUF4230 domain-containing protein [Anaerolineales bacterium]
MEVKDDNMTPSVSQTTVIILSILVAVVILAGIGLIYWLTAPDPSTSVAENKDIPRSTETWPTVPPTFTPTSSPTSESTPTPTTTLTPTPTPAPTATPTPIVVGWRELGYLTTAEFTAVTVTEFTRERRFAPDEKIILKAVGKIQTGIDMSQIEDSDVEVSGTSVKIVLPRAKVTSIDLLRGETQIIDKGLFPGEGLETAALDKARTDLEQWAVGQGNLLDLSEKLGKIQLESFLRQLGFREIIITFKNKQGI